MIIHFIASVEYVDWFFTFQKGQQWEWQRKQSKRENAERQKDKGVC